MIPVQKISSIVERVDLHRARKTQSRAHAVTQQCTDKGPCDTLMFHWDGVAGDDLGARGYQIDCECRDEHCGEAHGPIRQSVRDGCQENVINGYAEASNTNNDLSRYSRDQPGGEECIGASDDCQWQILHTDLDEGVAADSDHVDVHVPEEDT